MKTIKFLFLTLLATLASSTAMTVSKGETVNGPLAKKIVWNGPSYHGYARYNSPYTYFIWTDNTFKIDDNEGSRSKDPGSTWNKASQAKRRSSVAIKPNASLLILVGNYAYVFSPKFVEVIDVSNLDSAMNKGGIPTTLETPGDFREYDVSIDNKTLRLARGYMNSTTFDLSNPLAPKQI